jgi:hypothetical protein
MPKSGASPAARPGYASHVSRRGFIALGGTGAAGAVLAACGEETDPRETGDDNQLTAAEAEAEQRLAAAYDLAASTVQGSERAALTTFAEAATARSNEFGGGSAQAGADGGPDSGEALSACINLANAAIAAHRAAVTGLDSIAGRGLATSALVACAAELAAVSGFAGEPEVPRAFVTGGSEEPYQAASDSDSETTSTTSTSTGEGE